MSPLPKNTICLLWGVFYEGLDMSKIKEEKTELIKGTMWTYFLYYKNFEGENKIRKMTLDINTGEYKIDDSQK